MLVRIDIFVCTIIGSKKDSNKYCVFEIFRGQNAGQNLFAPPTIVPREPTIEDITLSDKERKEKLGGDNY